MLEFVYAMQRVAKAIDLDERSICVYIADGVTTDKHVRASLYEAQTIQELKTKLNLLERAAQKAKVPGTKDCSVELKPTTIASARKATVCYNCGVPGHRVRDCEARSKGPKCYSCGEWGHVIRNCPKKYDKDPSNTLHISGENVGTIVMRIGQCTLTTLFDTGSELCLLSDRARQNIGGLLLLESVSGEIESRHWGVF